MKPKSRLTPYPILADYNDDYIEGSFSATIESFAFFGKLQVNVDFNLDNPELLELVDRGLARYTVQVECPQTSYRREISDISTAITFTIDEDELMGSLEICAFLVARNLITSFSSNSLNGDYRGLSFDFEKGNILAIGSAALVKIVKDENDLEQLPSIIKVFRNTEENADALCVNTDDSDHILIGISDGLYQDYCHLGQGAMRQTVFALVVFPALMVVLTRMSQAAEGDADKRWFKTIESLLERNGLSLDDLTIQNKRSSVLSVAQKLFKDPISRSLVEIKEFTEAR